MQYWHLPAAQQHMRGMHACAGQGGIDLLGNKMQNADQELRAGNTALVSNCMLTPWGLFLCPRLAYHVHLEQCGPLPGCTEAAAQHVAPGSMRCAVQIGNITLGIPVRMYRKNKHKDSDWGENAAHLMAARLPRHCMNLHACA